MSYKVKQQARDDDRGSAEFRTFEDLEVYKAAREFRRKMYAVTRELPNFEKFELASQIRRAAVSLTSNIAEGHGRFHFPDQVRFFLASRGSLQELVDDLNVCIDEKYLLANKADALKSEAWAVLALLNGFLRYLRDRRSQQSATVRESTPDVQENYETDALLDEVLSQEPER